ncbi:hypothetical protein [Clostridium thermarum]|uniref:hypothetical protein n=1 Tax=Clostridium thermarum TaxID=1716543 RepID=UPI0013D0FFCD|nr:hypothetical protein [Clostridium thermarum]
MLSTMSATPIYTNNNIIYNLGATLIEGYIESTSVRNALGLTGTLKYSEDNKLQTNSEDKLTSTSSGDSNYFDGRLDYKNEVNVKTIYSTFYLFNSIRDVLVRKNELKFISDNDIIENRIKCGQYIEFNADLSTTSLLTEVSTIVDVLSSYDIKILDELLKSRMGGYMTCSAILNQLKCLCNCLNRNNSTDLIMNLNNSKAILNINANYFCDKNSCIYDTANTNCYVLCKVIRCIKKESNCCLLRKTAMSDYYNRFLAHIKPYLNILNENGILVPANFETKVVGPAIQAIPVAMYI